jgi:hypothetical protein
MVEIYIAGLERSVLFGLIWRVRCQQIEQTADTPKAHSGGIVGLLHILSRYIMIIAFL